MRLLFAGTPDVALPALDALVDSRHEVVAVLTRPDAPAGRGRGVAVSPVKRRAAELGLEVLTPASPRDPAFGARLAELAPDCALWSRTAACCARVGARRAHPRLGQPPLLAAARMARRGARPARAAAVNEVTGATTFRIEQGPGHRARARDAHRDRARPGHRG